MGDLKFRTISDKSECKKLWETFSPQKTLDDNWDFREIYIKEFGFELNFITGFDGNNPIGILPLQLNTNKGISQKLLKAEKPFLEFFAGVDSDSNDVLTLPEYADLKNSFYNQIKSNAILTGLKSEIEIRGKKAEFMLDKFVSDLQKVGNFEDFLSQNFSGKTKRNLIHRIRHMQKNHQIEIRSGEEKDLEVLFEFSIQRFGVDSSFNMPYRGQIYKELFNKFDHDLFLTIIDGKVKGVAFCLIYKETYTLLNVGYDIELRDVGKLIVSEQINRAVKFGCKLYDAGQGDNGWKERFHLTKIQQFKLELNF